MKAKIVLDPSFGDGGKGLTVDNLCSEALRQNKKTAVVRFSGGQQCGHTVIRNGIKHVFSSYGSGSLQSVPTYYTADTTMYLPFMQNEFLQLAQKMVIAPSLWLHPHTRVTTPYDVAYNRAKEIHSDRHGSCGMGVGATMKRHDETPYRIFASDFNYLPAFREKLNAIRDYYFSRVHVEATEQGNTFNKLGYPFYKTFTEEARKQLDVYEYSLDNLRKINAFGIGVLDDGFDEVIYEGSQGIMLDMDHGIFPNVTYAHTTSKNAVSDIQRLGITDAEVYYATRCYTTRHGRGWMPNETRVDLVNTDHEINVTNEWQENLRIGEFDYDLINHAINLDAGYHPRTFKKNLVLTCMDQRPTWTPDYQKFDDAIDKFYHNYSPHSGNMFLA